MRIEHKVKPIVPIQKIPSKFPPKIPEQEPKLKVFDTSNKPKTLEEFDNESTVDISH